MLVLGQAALLVAVIAAAWSLFAGLLGGVNRSANLTSSSARGLVACAALTTLSVTALLHGLLTNAFHVRYVAEYSSRQQPLIYKLSALWGGQDGSLLLWAFLLALFGSIVVALARRNPPELMPWVYASLGGVLLFFLCVATFVANPFRVFAPAEIPPNGIGLNPLLQNPWMMIHPPTLYLGYVGVTVPFAFAVAALVTGRLTGDWIAHVRRWTLFTWTFLSIGIWLGAYWAYLELGWGGFWAWDPVENASFLPWLTLTAFLHAMVVQETRGTFRTWSVSLVLASFVLSVFGTFVTRSGIIASVHAFAKSSIGTWFLVFLVSVTLGCLALLFWRLGRLRSTAPMSAIWTREGMILLGNVVLVGVTAMVFILTMWPTFTGMSGGEQQTLEPMVYTRATRPLFLVLLLVMATGPLVGWRGSSARETFRRFALPAAFALALVVGLFLSGAREPWSLAFFAASMLVAAALVQALVQDVRRRRATRGEGLATATARELATHRRRYGAHLVHLSVVVMATGIAASMAYKTEHTFESIPAGQVVEVDGYRLTYRGFDVVNRPEFDGVIARFDVVRPGSGRAEPVSPERRAYHGTNQPSTEVSILPTLLPRSVGEIGRLGEDLYVIPLHVDTASGTATINVLVHPFVNWLWAGGILLILGAHLAAWPSRAELREYLVEATPAAPAI
ncbi:MAG: heme lyase CcmF/NrfE family subunit [Acidobacteria bacterium]|nr:heme lyase CcmF/NrfE family subunit [Acidobacteriota bacterium]